MLVPAMAETVTITALSRPVPGTPKHTTRVLEIQTAVEHCVPSCPILIVVVASAEAKFVPSMVRLLPPVTGALSTKLLRTGES